MIISIYLLKYYGGFGLCMEEDGIMGSRHKIDFENSVKRLDPIIYTSSLFINPFICISLGVFSELLCLFK